MSLLKDLPLPLEQTPKSPNLQPPPLIPQATPAYLFRVRLFFVDCYLAHS